MKNAIQFNITKQMIDQSIFANKTVIEITSEVIEVPEGVCNASLGLTQKIRIVDDYDLDLSDFDSEAFDSATTEINRYVEDVHNKTCRFVYGSDYEGYEDSADIIFTYVKI